MSAIRRLAALPIGVLGLAACLLASGDAVLARSGTAGTELADAVYGSCMQAMATSVCSVSNDAGTSPAATAQGDVFVVGIGRIDSASYRRIQASGDDMCREVRKTCLEAPEGVQCRTARQLWSAPPR